MSMDLNRKKSFIPLIYHQIQEKEPSHTNGFQGQWKSIANIRLDSDLLRGKGSWRFKFYITGL